MSLQTSALHFEPEGSEPGRFVVENANWSVSLGSAQVDFELRSFDPASIDRLRQRGLRRHVRHDEDADVPPVAKVTTVRMRLAGALPTNGKGVAQLPGVSHYYIGNDPSGWRTHVPTFARVLFQDVYPGIDVVYYGADSRLEFDFVVHPGADTSRIQLAFEGASAVQLADDGTLRVGVPGGELLQHRPHIYQERAGVRSEVGGAYELRSNGSIGLRLEAYDSTLPLVIDPVLEYAHFVNWAANSTDKVVAAADGSYYLLHNTVSGSKFIIEHCDPQGTTIYSNVINGMTGADVGYDLAVGATGKVYFAGYTTSTDLPVNAGGYPPFQADNGGGQYGPFDAIVGVLNENLTLRYLTYLGGAGYDLAAGVGVDAAGNFYAMGETKSANFPGFNTPTHRQDLFAVKFSPDGQGPLLYTRRFGGANNELASDLAVDDAGNAYLAGVTYSSDFPVVVNALQPSPGSSANLQDGFLVKLTPDNVLTYATYLGGAGYDWLTAVAVDGAGNAFVTGCTNGTARFPGAPADGAQPMPRNDAGYAGWSDAFIAKITADGSAYGGFTFLGGSREDCAYGIAVDGAGAAYVVGTTNSTDLLHDRPGLESSIQGTISGENDSEYYDRYDVMLGKLDPGGAAFRYLSYFGGDGPVAGDGWDEGYSVAVAPGGVAYFVGFADSAFPIQTHGEPGGGPAFGSGSYKGFVMKVREGDNTIRILPSTTRWKAQRSDDLISVMIGSSKELDASQQFTLGYTGKKTDGTVVAPPTEVALPATAMAIPPPGYGYGYTLSWNGLDATGAKLPAGNYALVVRAPVLASQTPAPPALESPEYDKVSMVEVRSVKFLGLSENALVAEAGGNSRIFAEAKTPPTNAIPNPSALDMVAVDAEVEPLVEGVTVPVYFLALVVRLISS